ncbi:MAG: cytochrome c peroxidase [Saprospiraceae bacterium]
MKYSILLLLFAGFFWKNEEHQNSYKALYSSRVRAIEAKLDSLYQSIDHIHWDQRKTRQAWAAELNDCRQLVKSADFWLRYFEPLAYKKINGPLPVEWETEVFEKFERPYRRIGGGLSLSAEALEDSMNGQATIKLNLNLAREGIKSFFEDSVMAEVLKPGSIYFANRLFLLNLAALYTTHFECPDTGIVIPELKEMVHHVLPIYMAHNAEIDQYPLSENYLDLFNNMTTWLDRQADGFEIFDRFTFIRNFVDPLFGENQRLIRRYGLNSISYMDFSLSDSVAHIFDKGIYEGQDMLGIYRSLKDSNSLRDARRIGRLLFYDPVFSANNRRACASCHKNDQAFTDTTVRTAQGFGQDIFLTRNTPSLINVNLSHLLMLDGRHHSLFNQAKEVISNPSELNSSQSEILDKVLSIAEYAVSFKRLAKETGSKKVQFIHLSSAISAYLETFNFGLSRFDSMMRGSTAPNAEIARGFNLFMGKAECGTCHFVPHFNGSKPPYIGTEFEVLGVPADSGYLEVDRDMGRFGSNPVSEMKGAFRTNSLRNVARTGPYMHNGVFSSLSEVIEFYDLGGGEGRGLLFGKQTLSPASLHLTLGEKNDIIRFLQSLTENYPEAHAPEKLPLSNNRKLNLRKVGGEY